MGNRYQFDYIIIKKLKIKIKFIIILIFSLHKRKRLKLHEDLAKAESALAVQIRSEKMGFAKFLHTRRVPGVTSPACDCGWHSQTANHIIRWCPLRNDRNRLLANAETEDYRVLITTPKGLKLTTKWFNAAKYTGPIHPGSGIVVSKLKSFPRYVERKSTCKGIAHESPPLQPRKFVTSQGFVPYIAPVA